MKIQFLFHRGHGPSPLQGRTGKYSVENNPCFLRELYKHIKEVCG
jgi:hypothetical protein